MRRKGFICFLIILMIMSSQTTVFAVSENSEEFEFVKEYVKIDGTIVNDWKEDGVTIRTEDYTNGDVCVYVIKDEEILQTSYLVRNDQQIIDRDYITGEQSITKCEKTVVGKDSIYTGEVNSSRITEKYTSVGSIGYVLGVKKEGETTKVNANLKVERAIDTGSIAKDLNGKYKNTAALISRMCRTFSIVASVASPIAGVVLKTLGYALDSTDIIISSYVLKAKYETVVWHGIGFASNKVVQGTKYTFTLPDGSKEVQKEGDYYATNSITKQDNKLALKLGKLYYPGMTSYTVKWS